MADNSPVTPAGYAELLVVVANGNDGARQNSSISLDVRAPDGAVIQTFSLKDQNADGWDEHGITRRMLFPFNNRIAPNSVGSVRVHLGQHYSVPDTGDNWNMAMLQVRLVNPTGPQTCVVDGVGGPLKRFTEDDGSQIYNFGEGCPTPPSPQQPPSTTLSTMEFLIATGDDNLHTDAEATVGVSYSGGGIAEDVFTLKIFDDPEWANHTSHRIVGTLSAPVTLGDMDRLVLHLKQKNASCNTYCRNWKINAINVVAYNPGGPVYCITDQTGHPVVELTKDNAVLDIPIRSSCP